MPNNNRFFLTKTKDAKDLPLPKYMTEMAAGMDLYANVENFVIIKSGEYKLISTGIKIEMPPGYEAQIRPRSGLALKHGVTMLNSPGTIDSDYRGEIKVIMVNFGKEDFEIRRGERIAQMVISKAEQVKFEEVNELSETKRGSNGFGHTGKI